MPTFDREKVKAILKIIVVATFNAKSSESDLFRNTLDCFSCSIDAMIQNISIEEWMQQEKARQSQKTLQNSIGDFHQKVLGTLPGIKDLTVGGIVDLESEEQKFFAEVKNKHNTTKGNHKVAIYDDLAKKIANYPDYTGYYVEILPKNAMAYNKVFTPSDNTEADATKKRRPANERIRCIDGKTFYAKVTGNENALEELYNLLPDLIAEILDEEFQEKRDTVAFKNDAKFTENFQRIFPTEI